MICVYVGHKLDLVLSLPGTHASSSIPSMTLANPINIPLKRIK